MKFPYFLNNLKAYHQCLDIIAENNMIKIL